MMKNPFEILKTFFLRGIAFFVYILYTWYGSTLKITSVNNEFSPERLALGENAIYAFWHSKTFSLLQHCREAQMGVLTLLDWKNIIYDKVCRLYGCQTIPVTSFQKATVKLKRLLEKGWPVGLALDGPRGPAGVVKPGVFFLAKITGKPIVAVNVRALKSFRLRWRWDQYEIPFPFSEVLISLSKPFQIHETDERINAQRIEPFLKDL